MSDLTKTMMTKYKQKKQAQAARREMITGSILGGLLIAAMLGFMAWHSYMVDKWLELPF